MLKVFGFVRRHPRLSHDEYRAAHVGYHNSFGRRLRNIRGYVLNVRSNHPLDDCLGTLPARLTHQEPPDFDALWDGWGQLMFDSLDDYLAARTPTPDRAGPDGLEVDPKVAAVGGDGPHLYAGSPFQFHVSEHVAMPVRRPERKLFKLVQFVKRQPSLPFEAFRAYWTGRYAAHVLPWPGLRGYVINFRTELDVLTGFFPPGSDAFTPEGTVLREGFYDQWDGISELWFDEPGQFVAARSDPRWGAKLDALERELFAAVFYREVDETIAVLPNRGETPERYRR
jgi:hypothetical protein